MSRYIDADELLVMYKGNMLTAQTDYAEGIRDVIKDIKDAPSIDIVRCKECKYWNGETHGCKRSPSVEPWWENDFCKYGTRKTNTITEKEPTPIRDYMVYGERKESE